MKILTASEMQKIDGMTTERYGVPSLTLMENAGRGVLEFLADRFAPLDRQRITVVCGRGNNGGDGLVVARLLRARGLAPRIVLLGDPASLRGEAATNLKRLEESGASLQVAENEAAWNTVKGSLVDTTLLVDAMLGTGLSKPLGGFFLTVVRDLNNMLPEARVVAVDIPSGIAADTGDLIGECMRVDASVTFTAPKWAHVFPPACGRVGEFVVKQIGTPPEAFEGNPELFLNLTCKEDFGWIAEPRKLEAHKGNFGHVLILAGSVGKTGAAAMSAKTALRAGAGLVTIATPKSVLPIVAGLGMEFMTEPLPETELGTVSLRALEDGKLDKLVEGKSVLAIGPGLTNVDETAELVRTATNRYNTPIVLDADGLNAFGGCMDMLRADSRVRVLTPHPGEMARLSGLAIGEIQKQRVTVARQFASEHHVALVLKGFRTLTATPDGQVWVNPTGNPGMATGGTGDVLTGLVAGLLAQHPQRPVGQVVAAAVYLHGLAGDLAVKEMGEISLTAGDVLEAVPKAFKSLSQIYTW